MNIDFGIGRSALSEQVAQRLEKMILSDATQVSQKLPSEQVLAAGFGVSRPVVREALTILKERGLITQRQGGGSYITTPDLSQVSQCMNRLAMMGQITSEDVYIARISLEVSIIRMAAENATAEDVRQLQAINDAMKTTDGDVERRVQLDMQFHQQTAQIAGNQMLAIFLDSLNGILSPMVAAALKLPGAAQDGLNYHQRIIDCLQRGDADQAEEVMRQHLTLSMRNWEVAKETEQ